MKEGKKTKSGVYVGVFFITSFIGLTGGKEG